MEKIISWMQRKGDFVMIGKITEKSMKLIADEIIYEIAENTHFGREDSRAIIQRILEDNGIVEVIPD